MAHAFAGSVWEPSARAWRDRPVAVTGATGFLGAHLTDLLVALGSSVVVLVRDRVPLSPTARRWMDRVNVVEGCIEDQSTVERLLGEYDVDCVFHLAAQTQVGVANHNPVSTLDTNIRGTWSVLEAARRSPAVRTVVMASSDKAYGSQATLPYTEDMDLLAVHPYDVSKACADLVARTYAKTFGLPVAITRCGNFFGPGDINWSRLVPGTIRSLLLGERPVIRSDGSLTRDYLYVVDGAIAYLQLAEALDADRGLAGEAFNFSAERPLTVLQLVELLQAAAGTALEPDIRSDATHEIDHQFLSAAKARSRLGWRPHHTLEEALALTVAAYRRDLGVTGG